MIACTHHAAFHVWTLGLTKAFATLRLIMITIYKLQAKRKPELEWICTKGSIQTMAIKETTPTHTLGMPLHDCMHPPCCLSCVDTWFDKSLCHSPLDHDHHLQTAGLFFVHKISRAILGSQNALIKVGEVLRLWPAVIAILPSLDRSNCRLSAIASLSLGRGRRHPSVRIDRAKISCSISVVCWRESRTTTSIGMEEWCIGIVLAMTSKLICLKSSQVATDPTTFSNK